MGNSYSLADLKNDLDAKYAPLELDLGSEKLTLVNVMRLDAAVRKQVMTEMKVINQQIESPETDPVILDKAVNKVLQTVVADGKGKFLTDIVSGDTGLAMRIFELWMSVTQVGEASNSPDSSTSVASNS